MHDEAIRCSFCGKSPDAIGKMISSPKERPGAYICDQCVRACLEILDGEDQPATPQEEPPIVIPIWLARMFGDRKPN